MLAKPTPRASSWRSRDAANLDARALPLSMPRCTRGGPCPRGPTGRADVDDSFRRVAAGAKRAPCSLPGGLPPLLRSATRACHGGDPTSAETWRLAQRDSGDHRGKPRRQHGNPPDRARVAGCGMSLSTERPLSASNDDQQSTSERLARIREMNLKADEIRAEAGVIDAKKRLKEAKRGDWFVVPVALASMVMGAGVVAVGMLIGRLWK